VPNHAPLCDGAYQTIFDGENLFEVLDTKWLDLSTPVSVSDATGAKEE